MANEALWLKIGKSFEGRKRRAVVWTDSGVRLENPRDDAGRPLVEKIPGIGYVGNDLAHMFPMTQAASRFTEFLRHDGHTASIVLTSAAAHVQDEDNSYERDRRHKARHLGWIEFGKCPCAMLMNGDIKPEQLQSKECKGPQNDKRGKDGALEDAVTGRPCAPGTYGKSHPPCPHFLAERKARRAQRVVDTTIHEAAYKTEAQKHTEAIVALGTSLTEAMQQQMAQAKAGSKNA